MESCIIDTADRGEAIVCTVWTLQGDEDPGIQPVGVATSCGQKDLGHKDWLSRKGWGFLVRPSELAVGMRLGSGTRETCAEPQDSPVFDGLLDRATKFGRAHVFLPESTPLLQLMGREAGAPPLLRL